MDEKNLVKIFIFFIIIYIIFKPSNYEVEVEYLWDVNHPPNKAKITLNPHFMYTQSASADDTLPLIIALTGDSAKYENFVNTVFKDFSIPARVVILESPSRIWPRRLPEVEFYAQAIAEFAKHLANKYPTTGKPILFGFSGGGMMSYYSALTHCEAYSIIVPVAGALTSNQKTYEPLITMDDNCKVVAFHGNKDRAVAFSRGKKAFEILNNFSKNIEFIEFNGVHLDIFNDYNKLIMDKLAQTVTTEVLVSMVDSNPD